MSSKTDKDNAGKSDKRAEHAWSDPEAERRGENDVREQGSNDAQNPTGNRALHQVAPSSNPSVGRRSS